MTTDRLPPAADAPICTEHFSPRRDAQSPPICEKAYAMGLFPCEFPVSPPRSSREETPAIRSFEDGKTWERIQARFKYEQMIEYDDLAWPIEAFGRSVSPAGPPNDEGGTNG